jgi:hypothetical protein
VAKIRVLCRRTGFVLSHYKISSFTFTDRRDSFRGLEWAHSRPMRLLPGGLCLCKPERFHSVRKFDHMGKLVVVSHDPVTDPPTGSYNQTA